VLAILYTLYFAAELFLPIFFAIFSSIILGPIVRKMAQAGIPRPIGAMVTLFTALALLVTATVNLSKPADDWLQRIPSIQRDIEAKLWPVTRSIQRAKEATEKLQDIAEGQNSAAKKPQVTVERNSMLDRVFETTWLTFIQLLIVFALTFFFLSQDESRTRLAIRRMPWRGNRQSLEKMFADVQATVTRYLQISAVIYLALGILTAVAMYLLSVPNPVLWGGMAAVFGFIPFVGPAIVTGCISVVSLLTFENWWQIAAPPLTYGVLTIVEGYFVTPTILGRRLTISPIAVFLSMLLWTWVWGMPGALLSVPVLVVLTTTTRHLVAISRQHSAAEAPATEAETAVR
jgi:predicted PurR-regulated permease PerM